MIELDFWEMRENWEYSSFESVVHTVSGHSFNSDRFKEEKSDSLTPVIRIRDIHNSTTEAYTDESFDEKYIVQPGDLLVGMDGNFEASLWSGPSAALNQRVLKIEPKENVKKEWIKFWLDIVLPVMQRKIPSSTVQHLSTNKHLNPSIIPVPPLDEQELIINEIEDRLEAIQSADQKVNSLHSLSTEYRDSAFAHLLSGVSMEGIDHNLSLPDASVVPDDWSVCELNEVAERLRSTYETESGVKYDLYSFESVDEGKRFFVTDGEEINSRKRELFGGEVLISRLNPRISRVCKVDYKSEYKQVASTEFVALELTSESVSREFLYQYLKTPLIREYLTNQTTGSTGSHSRVSFDEVMSLPVPIPPKEKQENLIRELSEIEKNTKTVEDSVNIVDQYLGEYKKSILHHAFTGELV